MDSDKRKMQDEETKRQEDVDEDEVELLQKDLETEEDL